jgi:hypothetical protein
MHAARSNKLSKALLLGPVLFCIGGCATGPGSNQAPSTPYKGDAVWNISSSAGGPSRSASSSARATAPLFVEASID